MNKENVLKQAKEKGAAVVESDQEQIAITFFIDELLAFANACEKIGMEKSEKICADRSTEFWKLKNTSGWSSYVEGRSDEADYCADAIRKAI